jgi:hypothetical protein
MTMFGQVNRNREAILKLVIIGEEDRKIAVDAVIDPTFRTKPIIN